MSSEHQTPGRAGAVVALHLHVEHGGSMEPVQEVVAVAGEGLEGDIHRGTTKRQILLIDSRILEQIALAPGDLREQITLDLPDLQSLPPGTRLSIGEAELEITGPCEPCTHIGELLGREDRESFRDHLSGRRGVLARVVGVAGEGRIRVRDPAVATVGREMGLPAD